MRRDVTVLLAVVLSAIFIVGCEHKRKKRPNFYAVVDTPVGLQEGVFEITYTLYDVNEEPVDVVVEFATRGTEYAPCTRFPGGEGTTGLSTAKDGISHSFRWNSVADSVALDARRDDVRIRITPYKKNAAGNPVAGGTGYSTYFTVDNSTGNSPPVVSITGSPVGLNRGNVSIWYSVSDAEGDRGYIEVLYRTGSRDDWQPATIETASYGTIDGNLLLNIDFTVSPLNGEVVWDTRADIGDGYAHEAQVRIVAYDARASAPADTSTFRIDNTTTAEPPVLSLKTPDSPARGFVRIEYELSDNNAETAFLLFEVSLDGGISYRIPALIYSSTGERVNNSIQNVETSPTSQTHYVVWNTFKDVGLSPNTNVRFRAKASSSVQGVWVETDDFTVDNSSPPGGPTAVITVDRVTVQNGEAVQFSALDSAGDPVSFLWSFGDGYTSTEAEPLHTYDLGEGEFTVILTVTDSSGRTDTTARTIRVTESIVDKYTELEPYRNYSETRALLDELAESYPDILRVYTIGYSVEGREIFVVKVSDNVFLDEDEPTVHFDAQHHAREVMTPEVIIDIVEQLVKNYGSDPEVTGWVNDYETYLIPCVNPDMSVAVFTTDWGIRKNARGVDLNRNYPADWGNPDGSSGDPVSQTYRGPFPASEPEVQAVIAHSLLTRPVAGITFHSYSNIVLYEYSSPGLTQTSQEPYLMTVAQTMANSMQKDIDGSPYDYAHALWYDASGVTFDWMYRDVGTFCFLVEVGDSHGGGLNGFHPDYGSWHDPQVEGVRGGVAELFRFVGKGAICGHIRDADTGEPLEAEVEISGFVKPNGEIRRSEPKFGSFYWLWEDGDYTVTFHSEGYVPQSFDITVAGAPCILDVALTKDPTSNHRPTASFTIGATYLTVGNSIILDATSSYDEDGDPLTYLWDFGDGEQSSLPVVTHRFNRTGTHLIKLRVEDDKGASSEVWKLLHILPPSEAPILRIPSITGTFKNDIYIPYSLKTPSSKECRIGVEYSFDGLLWYPATVQETDEGTINGNIVDGLSSEPDAVNHYFIWDGLADIGSTGPVTVLLKITPSVPAEAIGDAAIVSVTVDNR